MSSEKKQIEQNKPRIAGRVKNQRRSKYQKLRSDRRTTSKKSLALMITGGFIIGLLGFLAGTRANDINAWVAPLFGNKVVTDSLDTDVLQQAYRVLKLNYDGELNNDDLINGAIKGMTGAVGDQYTVFMDPKEAEEFNKSLNGQISGIGCEIGIRGDQPTVVRVLKDSPAEKAGVRAGDVFVGVNDQSVVGKSPAEVADLVRGDEGTTVKIAFTRGDTSKEFTITRAQISDPSVRSEVIDGVGVITLSRFDMSTSRLAKQTAKDLVADGVKSIVLDLRNNGGGYLTAAQDVASLWIGNNKPIVSERSNGIEVQSLKANRGKPVLAGIKTVVLVNGGTASASEIVVGALQDYGLATIVGEKSFGKGSVQEVINIPGDRLLKVTIAKWYTPNGKNITKDGIKPDKKVEFSLDDSNQNRDPQMAEAIRLAGS